LKAALGQVAEEIKSLEAEIVAKERWETRLVRRRDVDTVCGAFGDRTAKVVREEVMPQTALVGAEKERERLERALARQAELQGLSSAGVAGLKDYRELKASDNADGGRGVDFRQRDRFGAKMKARDFEDEAVLSDAIRFVFRKAPLARVVFGETESTRTRRLAPDEIPKGYFEVALALREKWQDQSATGTEKRPFGKAMMDRCQAWHTAFKANRAFGPDASAATRDESLRALLQECGLGSEALLVASRSADGAIGFAAESPYVDSQPAHNDAATDRAEEDDDDEF
jgi:hypothetical protein